MADHAADAESGQSVGLKSAALRTMPPMQNSPYSKLDPDAVLDALEHIGMRCDGRLLTLNSYENRVFQVGMEDGPPLVAKFYRAGRWSDEAILEEHRYSALLAEREIPVVPPLNISGSTLHSHQGYRYALFNKQGGRAPELDRPETLQWMGRFIARIHAVGALDSYQHRPTLDIASFGIEPSEYLLKNDFIPSELREVYRGVVAHALDGVRRSFDRAGAVRTLRLHGDCQSII